MYFNACHRPGRRHPLPLINAVFLEKKVWALVLSVDNLLSEKLVTGYFLDFKDFQGFFLFFFIFTV